jgi:hypothetical protein
MQEGGRGTLADDYGWEGPLPAWCFWGAIVLIPPYLLCSIVLAMWKMLLFSNFINGKGKLAITGSQYLLSPYFEPVTKKALLNFYSHILKVL